MTTGKDPLTNLPIEFIRMLAVKVDPYHDALMPSQIKFLREQEPRRDSGNSQESTEMRSEEARSENNLPAVVAGDGFDDTGSDDRLIQGTIIKCVDGHWSAKDDTALPPGMPLIALATAQALQRWQDQIPVETIVKRSGQSLPDVDELNAKIPQKKWEKGLDGKPRAPWSHQYIVYLLNPADASLFTFINNTVGAMVAVERLKDKVKWMRGLRGARVVPVVELNSKPMKTKVGAKQRPEFTITEWRDFGGLQTMAPALEHVGQPVTEPTLAEELNDDIPSFEADDN